MLKSLFFICFSFYSVWASVQVYSFNESECLLRIPAGKQEEKRKFIRQSSTFTEMVDVMERPFLRAWEENDVQEIIDLYEKWSTDTNFTPLAGYFFFPAQILDITSCASYHEQNEAIKLSILLAAKFGHLEARMIAFTIFDDARFSTPIRARFKELQNQCKEEIIQKSYNGHPQAIELLLDPILSLGKNDYISQHIAYVEAYTSQVEVGRTLSTRTLLRCGNAYWKIGNYDRANYFYDKAILKGSKRAFSELMNGLIFREDLLLHDKQTEIHRVFSSYEYMLGGYDYLIHAHFYQFGLYDIIDRNLKTANQFYKKATSHFCAQACLDYGDFLIATTQAFPQDNEKIKRFYKLAIDSYEKGGLLGKTNGYNKAAGTLLHGIRSNFFNTEDILDVLVRVADFYQKVLWVAVDPILLEKIRTEDLVNEVQLGILQQHQVRLQQFILQNYQMTFSVNLEETD